MKIKDEDIFKYFIIPILAFIGWELFKGNNLTLADLEKVINKIQDENMRAMLKDEKKQENILKEVNKILKEKI